MNVKALGLMGDKVEVQLWDRLFYLTLSEAENLVVTIQECLNE